MAFFLLCFGLVTLISSKCYFDGELHRRQYARRAAAERTATAMERYEKWEDVAIEMINVTTPPGEEREQLIADFYRDYPPPYARPIDLERSSREGKQWQRGQPK